jgi:tetratricopeptide (TPR) repeat protein
MIRWTLPFVLVLHSALLAAQQADSTLISKATEQLKNKQCKEVVRTLAPMLDRSPAPAEALLLRAKCRIWFTKELEAGMRDLQDALDQEPEHVAIRAFRGDLYNDMRMFDRARSDLDIALAHASDTANLLYALTRSSWNNLQMRRFDAARVECARILELDSLNRGGLNNLALVARETNDTALAVTTMRRIITVYPDERTGWLNLGFLMGTLGRHAEALEYYDHAEKMGEKDAYFHSNRGYSRLGVGDTKGARQDVERAIKMMSTNSYAYRNLALIELKEDRKDAACTALERSIEYGFTKTYGNEVIELRKKHCQ